MAKTAVGGEIICNMKPQSTVPTAAAGSVSVAFVREALAQLQARGFDPAPVLAAARIAPEALADEQGRVSADSFGVLWRTIAALLGDEFFGLDSHGMKVGSFATLCQLALHTRTLREALSRAARFCNLLLDDTRVELVEQDALASIRLTALTPGDDRRVFAHETLFVIFYGLTCWLIDRRVVVRRACFSYPQPAWWHEYTQIYSSEVAFDTPDSALEFSSAELDAPIAQTERSARDFLKLAPGSFILKYKNPNSIARQVHKRLASTAPPAWPRFAALAAELHLSAATLHRHLAREGTSFRLIKDALRRDAAIRYLKTSPLSVVDIASELGFAEASAFHRAFRHWTGTSPAEYRARSAAETARP